MISVGKIYGIEVNENLINKLHFILKHVKTNKFVIYTKEFGEDGIRINNHKRHSSEDDLFNLGVKEFLYISSNGSQYYKEFIDDPNPKYDWRPYKCLKKKEK